MSRRSERDNHDRIGGLRPERSQERWALIRPHLGPDDKSLLDVGCGEGYVTLLAGEAGLFSLGVDVTPQRVRQAFDMRPKDTFATFLQYSLTPEVISGMPVFDVVLFLSAHHTIQRINGKRFADELLAALGKIARNKLFFEPPSSKFKKRYGRDEPQLVEGDPDSIIPYYTDFLKTILGEPSIKVVGSSTGPRGEANRYMFMVDFTGERKNGSAG